MAFNCIFESVIVEQLVGAGFLHVTARVIVDSLTQGSFSVVTVKFMSNWRLYYREISQSSRLDPLLYIVAANVYLRAV